MGYKMESDRVRPVLLPIKVYHEYECFSISSSVTISKTPWGFLGCDVILHCLISLLKVLLL